jgi:hypothetical protein
MPWRLMAASIARLDWLKRRPQVMSRIAVCVASK